MRVSQFLSDQHVSFETVVHPPAFTAQKRARFLHISGREVVKSVLLVGDHRYFLAVLSAADHVDLEAVSLHLREHVRLADENEIAELFRDCERGALTPFGSLYGLITLLEDSLHPSTTIVFEAQSHAVAIRMQCRDFEMLEKPRRVRFAAKVASTRV